MGLYLEMPGSNKIKPLSSLWIKTFDEGKVITELKDVPRTHELPKGDNFGGIILRKPYAPEEYLNDEVYKTINSQHKGLADALRNEGIPVRYFMREVELSGQIFATDAGKLVNVNDRPMFIGAYFGSRSNSRTGEEATAKLLMEGNLGIPFEELKDSKGRSLTVEGGDVRQMPGYDVWFIGGGIFTGITDDKTPEEGLKDVCRAFARKTGKIAIPINLKDPNYFHLDCCFLPLERDKRGNPWAVIYEGETNRPTMDENSLKIIKKLYGKDHLIKITKSEAENFATNSVIIENGKKEKCIFTPKDGFHKKTIEKLRKLGYKIIEIPYDKIHIGAGSIRCTCQEVPKSLLKDIMKPQDDSRLDNIHKSLGTIQRKIVFDRNSKDFVLMQTLDGILKNLETSSREINSSSINETFNISFYNNLEKLSNTLKLIKEDYDRTHMNCYKDKLVTAAIKLDDIGNNLRKALNSINLENADNLITFSFDVRPKVKELRNMCNI